MNKPLYTLAYSNGQTSLAGNRGGFETFTTKQEAVRFAAEWNRHQRQERKGCPMRWHDKIHVIAVHPGFELP
jgi:hypothetical protein